MLSQIIQPPNFELSLGNLPNVREVQAASDLQTSTELPPSDTFSFTVNPFSPVADRLWEIFPKDTLDREEFLRFLTRVIKCLMGPTRDHALLELMARNSWEYDVATDELTFPDFLHLLTRIAEAWTLTPRDMMDIFLRITKPRDDERGRGQEESDSRRPENHNKVHVKFVSLSSEEMDAVNKSLADKEEADITTISATSWSHESPLKPRMISFAYATEKDGIGLRIDGSEEKRRRLTGPMVKLVESVSEEENDNDNSFFFSSTNRFRVFKDENEDIIPIGAASEAVLDHIRTLYERGARIHFPVATYAIPMADGSLSAAQITDALCKVENFQNSGIGKEGNMMMFTYPGLSSTRGRQGCGKTITTGTEDSPPIATITHNTDDTRPFDLFDLLIACKGEKVCTIMCEDRVNFITRIHSKFQVAVPDTADPRAERVTFQQVLSGQTHKDAYGHAVLTKDISVFAYHTLISAGESLNPRSSRGFRSTTTAAVAAAATKGKSSAAREIKTKGEEEEGSIKQKPYLGHVPRWATTPGEGGLFSPSVDSVAIQPPFNLWVVTSNVDAVREIARLMRLQCIDVPELIWIAVKTPEQFQTPAQKVVADGVTLNRTNREDYEAQVAEYETQVAEYEERVAEHKQKVEEWNEKQAEAQALEDEEQRAEALQAVGDPIEDFEETAPERPGELCFDNVTEPMVLSLVKDALGNSLSVTNGYVLRLDGDLAWCKDLLEDLKRTSDASFTSFEHPCSVPRRLVYIRRRSEKTRHRASIVQSNPSWPPEKLERLMNCNHPPPPTPVAPDEGAEEGAAEEVTTPVEPYVPVKPEFPSDADEGGALLANKDPLTVMREYYPYEADEWWPRTEELGGQQKGVLSIGGEVSNKRSEEELDQELIDAPPCGDKKDLHLLSTELPLISLDDDGQSSEDLAQLVQVMCESHSAQNMPMVLEGEDPKVHLHGSGFPGLRWSDWQQTCPVTFRNHRRVEPGQLSFTCTWADKLYTFASKECMDEFVKAPKLYASRSPTLECGRAGCCPVAFAELGRLVPVSSDKSLSFTHPKNGLFHFATEQYRHVFSESPEKYMNNYHLVTSVALVAPPNALDKEVAQAMEKRYQWQIVDILELLKRDETKTREEFALLVADELNCGANVTNLRAYEEKLAQVRQQIEDANALEEEEKKAEALEALDLTEEGEPNVAPVILVKPTKSFILLNLQTKADLEALSEYGIEVQHVLTFSTFRDETKTLQEFVMPPAAAAADTSEDKPSAEAATDTSAAKDEAADGAGGDPPNADAEGEEEAAAVPSPEEIAAEIAKTFETNVSELEATTSLPLDVSAEDVCVMVCQSIDPFFPRVADPALVQDIPDPNEEPPAASPEEGDEEPPEPKILLYGPTGHYCPVTLKTDRWLVPGSLQFQCTFGHEVYAMATKEKYDAFVHNPAAYMKRGELPVAPPPRIMVTGTTASGVTTHCETLREKYKLPIIKLGEVFLTFVQEWRRARETRLISEQKEAFEAGLEGAERESYFSGSPVLNEEGEPLLNEEEEEIRITFQAQDVAAPGEDELQRVHEDAIQHVLGRHTGACIIDAQFFHCFGDVSSKGEEGKTADEEVETENLPTSETDIKDSRALDMLLRNTLKYPNLCIILTAPEEVCAERRIDIEEIDRLDAERKAEEKAERARLNAIAAAEAEETGEDPVVIEEPEEEGEDAVKASALVVDKFKEKIRRQKLLLKRLQEQLMEARVPVAEISTTRPISSVSVSVQFQCRPFTIGRASLFLRDQAVIITPKQAQRAVESTLACVATRTPRATEWAVYMKGKVYYLTSEEKRRKFLQNPVEDVGKKTFPHVKPAACVLGAPGTGKSDLAKTLCERFDAVLIRVEDVLQEVIDQEPRSQLGARIAQMARPAMLEYDNLLAAQAAEEAAKQEALAAQAAAEALANQPVAEGDADEGNGEAKEDAGAAEAAEAAEAQQAEGEEESGEPGEELIIDPIAEKREKIANMIKAGFKVCDDMLVAQAIRRRLLRVDALQHGWVLDSYPQTVEQAKALFHIGVRPRLSVVLGENTPQGEEKEPGEVERLEAYRQRIPSLRAALENISTVLRLDSSWTPWQLLDRTSQRVREDIASIEQYYLCESKKKAYKPVPIFETVSPDESRLSKFRNTCPVRWALNKEVVTSEDSKGKWVRYLGDLYFVTDAYVQSFISDPDSFIADDLPTERAREIQDPAPADLSKVLLRGNCPVSLKLKEELKTGYLYVEYMTRLYALHDRECLRAFLRRPQDFTNASMSIKAPPLPKFDAHRFHKVDLNDTLSFLQMSVSTALQQALHACSEVRPLYPNKSPKESALLFVAKHLRAHNSLRAKWITEKDEQKLNQYLRCCGLPDIITKQMDVTFLETSTNKDVKTLNALIAELRSIS